MVGKREEGSKELDDLMWYLFAHQFI